MSESPSAAVSLSPVAQKFILHWGEMGTRWGINRTVAQVHALLYLSPEPLNAEQITDTLKVARSNISTSIRELQGWGVIQVEQKLGDRRDYFRAETDVWELFRRIVRERKKRELDPTVELLQQCVAESHDQPAYLKERLARMLDFMETTVGAYESADKLPTAAIAKIVKMGDKLWKVLGVKP